MQGVPAECRVLYSNKFYDMVIFTHLHCNVVSGGDNTDSPSVQLEVQNVPIGPGKEQFLHTVVGGPKSSTPPVVWMPGYAAGVGFFYRYVGCMALHNPKVCAFHVN